MLYVKHYQHFHILDQVYIFVLIITIIFFIYPQIQDYLVLNHN